MGERFINIMVDSSDPRISVYCNRVSSGANAGGYVGITSGAPASVISKQSADGASNSNNTTFRQYTSPYTFMTYSEVLFIKAEAIQRGMMDGEASETYYAAVTASLKQWIPDISESAVETFLQNGAVAYDATTEIIITQKYVNGAAVHPLAHAHRGGIRQICVHAAAAVSVIYGHHCTIEVIGLNSRHSSGVGGGDGGAQGSSNVNTLMGTPITHSHVIRPESPSGALSPARPAQARYTSEP